MCWRRLPYREMAEELMFGNGQAATSHVGFFMFNRPSWPNLAASEYPSISAAACLAMFTQYGMPHRATTAPIVRLVRYRSLSCQAHQQPARQLMTRNGHFGCQFAVWFGAVSDGLVRRHAIVMANLMFSFMLF